jgi:hypothetical protein
MPKSKTTARIGSPVRIGEVTPGVAMRDVARDADACAGAELE